VHGVLSNRGTVVYICIYVYIYVQAYANNSVLLYIYSIHLYTLTQPQSGHLCNMAMISENYII